MHARAARGALGGYLTAIRSRKVDDQTWDDLEEALIRADVGVATTTRLLEASTDKLGVHNVTIAVTDPDGNPLGSTDELPIRYNGDPLDIGFNVNYLLDVLNNVAGETIECAFGDAASSALITYGSEKDFKYVVMPMRI